MKSQQTPINGRLRRRPRLPSAATKAALGFEERVIWPSEDAARTAGGAARHGLDRALWELQRRLLWPAQDRARGLDDRARLVMTAGVALVAVAAGVAGLLLVSSGGSGGGSAPAQVAVAAPKTHTQTAHAAAKPKPAPTLHGAAPVFKPTRAAKEAAESSHPAQVSAPTQPATEAGTTASSSSAATDKISSSPSASASSAAAEPAEPALAEGPPAGPAAKRVAREFAGAFVVYETGGTEAKVRRAFKATTTPLLARELLRRPPKQPATVKVPRAKVVNVVVAPSRGSVFPVSVSLLRVGVTSELRLSMEKTKKSGWQITDVLG